MWAPRASSLVLEVNGESVSMHGGPDGWWSADRQMRPGDLYGFVVNGSGPFPDPRSVRQPSGVHGLSEVIDHTSYAWSEMRWQAPPLSEGVIYELHLGTFSEAGTFLGAIDKLPHLASLGVTHVELMPIAEFPGDRGWGYDGVDLFAPHHGYGAPDDLKRLINACHAAGLAVLLDVVYNHLGPAGNYVSQFGPYFTPRHTTPWGDAINLDDEGSHEVRRFLCDNALMWLRDYRFDGLRLDAVHALKDGSEPHFLAQLSAEVEMLEAVTGGHYVLIAESDLNDPQVVRSRDASGFGLHAQWSDDFHHALHSAITGERSGYYLDFGRLDHLARAWQDGFVYAGQHSPHRGRPHGQPAGDVPGWRFVVGAQNHDQIGNRAMGERLAHLTSLGRLRVAAALVLTSPFVPLLFQGEEWGASTPFQYFTAHEDDELGRQVSEGRRREFAAFGWNPSTIPDPQSARPFMDSKLRWRELGDAPHAEMLEWHRALLALRRQHPSLRDGRFRDCQVTVDDDLGLLTIRRGSIVVACNLGDCPAAVRAGGGGELLLGSDPEVRLEGQVV
ncbi:MAG: malto-oligosyltrehalose trehalohydrolase, partial [Vicinamibacterales bacterium]